MKYREKSMTILNMKSLNYQRIRIEEVTLNSDIYAKLKKKDLESSEEILWEGKPVDVRLFREGDIKILISSLLWVFFVVYAIGLVQENSFSLTKVIILILLYAFLLRGIYFGIVRLYIRRRESINTFYLITKKRVLVIVNTLRFRVFTIEASDIVSVNKYLGYSPYEAICINYEYKNKTLMPDSSVNFMKLSKSKERFILYDLDDASSVLKLIESISVNLNSKAKL